MHTNVTRLAIFGGAAAFLAAATLAGCAAASTATTAATTPSATPSGSASQDRGGLTGEVVQVGDGTFLVQGDGLQTTVGYDASTTFTNQVSGSLADVTVGSCISAFGGTSDSGSSAVTTVTVSQAVDGECTSGFGGGGDAQFGQGGSVPSGMPTDGGGDFSGGMPSGGPDGSGGFPSGSATGAPGGGSFAGVGAFGKVTAVSGDTITVESTVPSGQSGSTASPSSSTVTVDASTTYQVEQAADASALAVGLCVTAQGTADTSGGYAATSVALSPKGEDGCSTTSGRGSRGSGQTTGQQG